PHLQTLSFCIRFRLLRPEDPLDAVAVRLGRGERPGLFESLARAALHVREDVLRHLCESPTSCCQRGRAEGLLQLPPLLLKETSYFHGQVGAECAECGG